MQKAAVLMGRIAAWITCVFSGSSCRFPPLVLSRSGS